MSFYETVDACEVVHRMPATVWLRPDLSVKAKGLLAVLLCFPPGFLPRVGDVERLAGMGRDARKAAYAELRDAGLLQSRFGGWSVVLPDEAAQ